MKVETLLDEQYPGCLQCARVGIYVRESRDDNDENYETIETQRELLIDFVAKNRLGEVVKVYEDNNVSGTSFERRGIRELREDVISGEIDILVLKDLSRLGRNNAKTLLFLDYLEEYGITVITSDGRYDSRKDNDIVGIETWFNERYAKDISRKIRANLRFKIQRGEYIGRAPFGYRKSDEEKNRLVVDPEKAAIVREIFDLYLEGYGYSSIAKILNDRGCPPPGKSARGEGWNAVAVGRILGNRVYIGDTVQGVSEKISFKSKKTRRLPREKWVLTPGTHEPIISREKFEEVQKLRRSKRDALGPHKGEIHVFRGLLFCGRCGQTMVARSRKNRPMGYICSQYARYGKKGCTSHYINEKALGEVLTGEILDLLYDEKIKPLVKAKLAEKYSGKTDLEKEAERLELQLAARQRQQDILYRDKLEGKISEELFTRTNNYIEKSISLLKDEIRQLREAAARCFDPEEALRKAAEILSAGGLTNRLVRMLVDSVSVYEAGELPDNREEKADKNNDAFPEVRECTLPKNEGAVIIRLKINNHCNYNYKAGV